MTTTREDVLLQMGEVRFKKGDGTLYVMNERIAWIAEHRDTVAASHRFQDIKMQKISPEGKPKIQLQVVLHDGNSSTFHFVNKLGAQAQIQDRDKVKELLQQLLPNFKRKVDKELEEKNRLLTENPSLLQLYKDLVITQVLSSEEFWSTHAKNYTQKESTQRQNIGVSGAFLADIKPQTDGCNGLKYNLTADIIESIFKTYPAVKRKHGEYVPAKLSESEFWTKFFQSHYFHRDRITSGTKDIFTECGKIDDQQLKLAVNENQGDPLLDLRSFEDNTLEEGFGGSSSNKSIVNSGNIVHQNMIKRFNQHSFMVLKTCTDVKTLNRSIGSILNATAGTNGDATTATIKEHNNNNNVVNGYKTKDKRSHESNNHNDNNQDSAIFVEPEIKRARIIEKITYDDLDDHDEQTNAKKSAQLNLTKIERYLHGPVPISSSSSSSGGDVSGVQSGGTSGGSSSTNNSNISGHNYLHQQEPLFDLDSTLTRIMQSTESWNNRTPHKLLVSATSAVSALGELSPGGALMRGFQEQNLAQLVPPDIEKEVKNLYLSLLELLKHFWKSFPPTTPELEARAVRMHQALQRFSIAKLKPFEDRAMRELASLGSLTQHLNQLLASANRKFVTWQERQRRR
uniref:General transcription factor IIH subunit 1 n=1 Tax=Corethrella appendiculata TaxID=1370023 RepID=U5EYR7_9DIPT